MPRISVVLPTRDPHRGRLGEVLAALNRQTLARDEWELCLVDNGSSPPLRADEIIGIPVGARLVVESRPGLLWARLAGLHAAASEYVVFLDDDTVPAEDFLAEAVAFMEAHPGTGTAGGKIIGRFEVPPPDWITDSLWCLALRDNGDEPLIWSLGSGDFPSWTPIGAGLLVRRNALVPSYVRHVAMHSDAIESRSWIGQGVGGVEDKDLVLHCLRAGWSTAYIPRMRLTHLIPSRRLERTYIERLIPGLERIWMRTLHAHGMDLFLPIHPATLWLRQIKAWFIFGAWRSPRARLAWLLACGRLRGLAENYRDMSRYPSPQDP